jgi:uncharacterized membrane protein
MNTKTTNILMLLLVVGTIITGVILYPYLPAQVASHWNTAGEVNGYMGKFWGVFLVPLIMAGLFVLYAVIPRIDPMKENIASFRRYYNGFWVLISLFFVYVFALQLIYNLGVTFDFTYAMVPALAVLWYVLGAFMEKTKRNWFVGIRTPWTLSSDKVWDKTHALAGKLFKFAAVLSLSALLFKNDAVVFVLVGPAVVVALVTIVYSYVVYKKSE